MSMYVAWEDLPEDEPEPVYEYDEVDEADLREKQAREEGDR